MRSMKEVFEIIKKHHRYWDDSGKYSDHYMCIAASWARVYGAITDVECLEALNHINTWMSESFPDIGYLPTNKFPALYVLLELCPYEDEERIKDWWEVRISLL